MMSGIKTYRPILSIIILVILYAVGLWGLGTSHRDWFLAATPITLLISSGMLLLNHEDWNFSAVIAVLICIQLGFIIEVIGVNTGAIFGEYTYGATLGIKLWNVPLVIALNWLLLVYSIGSLVARLQLPKVLQAAMGAVAMTGLDFLIEPVAMRLDFWQWENGNVPWMNYLAWLVVAFALLSIFLHLRFQKQNPVAGTVLALQFVFFGTLNFMH